MVLVKTEECCACKKKIAYIVRIKDCQHILCKICSMRLQQENKLCPICYAPIDTKAFSVGFVVIGTIVFIISSYVSRWIF